jgi:hypothetical protein
VDQLQEGRTEFTDQEVLLRDAPIRADHDAGSKQAAQVRFLVGGQRIAPADTAEKLGLENEHLIAYGWPEDIW